MIKKNHLAKIFLFIFAITTVYAASFVAPLGAVKKASASSFDANNLINDPTFINIDAMSASSIQNFLAGKGSFLANMAEGGRSAAQIIYDASHGYGAASGTINGITVDTSTGTVNPEVILTTLQKEQGLISMASQNNVSLSAAMGYACPDSGSCNPTYAGFTKQVENAAWQLRYNYERAGGHGFSDYQVGQTGTFSDFNGTHSAIFSNRATASLYRYTPHVYNGNYNFWYLFDLYFPTYLARFVSQTVYPTINDGETTTLTITYANTGSATWQQGVVNLGTVNTNYSWSLSRYAMECNWFSYNRPALLNESSVAPGANGSFTFTIRNTKASAGNHRLDVGLVADGITWFPANTHAYWDVTVNPLYQARFVSQSAYPTINNGETKTLTITYANTGSTTWQQGVVNLGTVDTNYNWLISRYDMECNWFSRNRPALLNEGSVPPGANGSFTFTIRNTGLSPGNHRLDVGLVADGITWFPANTHAYWDVTVNPLYQARFVSQTAYPTVNSGETKTLTITYANTGSTTWQQGVVNLGTVNTNYSWRLSRYDMECNWFSFNRPAQLNEGSVPPGANGSFTFTIRNSGLLPGNHRLDVGLVADGITWFPANTHAYWDVAIP